MYPKYSISNRRDTSEYFKLLTPMTFTVNLYICKCIFIILLFISLLVFSIPLRSFPSGLIKIYLILSKCVFSSRRFSFPYDVKVFQCFVSSSLDYTQNMCNGMAIHIVEHNKVPCLWIPATFHISFCSLMPQPESKLCSRKDSPSPREEPRLSRGSGEVVLK